MSFQMKSMDENGLKKQGLGELVPLFKKWFEVNEKFLNSKIKNYPWWYKERTLIGVLAGAAWLEGWLVLEEFSTTKTKDQDENKGRCDLRIFNGRKGDKAFSFEAKHIKDYKNRRFEKMVNIILDKLESAINDAKKLDPKTHGKRLAVCFYCPKIKKEDSGISREILNHRISFLKTEFKKRKINISMIWHFMDNPEKLSRNAESNHYYPGVLFLVKAVR